MNNRALTLGMDGYSTQMFDGGIRVSSGVTQPTHYYYTTGRGLTAMRKLKAFPKCELEQ